MLPNRIIVIGASGAQGKVDPIYGGYSGRLRGWLEKKNQHNHVYNLGISGDTSQRVLKRMITECPPRRPDLIICHLGSNDASRIGSKASPTNTPIRTFEKNVKKIIEYANMASKLIFISAIPIDESKTSPVWDNIYYLAKDVKKFAQATGNVCHILRISYIDIYTEFSKHKFTSLLHTDGLHANSKGHQLIYGLLKKQIVKMYNNGY